MLMTHPALLGYILILHPIYAFFIFLTVQWIYKRNHGPEERSVLMDDDAGHPDYTTLPVPVALLLK